MNINNCTKDIVVLLELTSISSKYFAVFSDARVNIMQFEVSRRILNLTLVENDFQYLVFKCSFLLIFDALFSCDPPLLFSSNLLFEIVLAILFCKELLSFDFLKFGQMLLLFQMDARFNCVKSVLTDKFIIFEEHIDLAEQPRQNILLQLGVKFACHEVHIS